METKLIINCLKQTLTELRDEKYQQEKNGLYKAAIDFVNMLEEALIIDGVSNCETKPKLNRLETELGKLQKVHGETTKHFEVHSGCDSFKFKDGAVYRVKIERNQTKATLD
jgi:hypothetical protein